MKKEGPVSIPLRTRIGEGEYLSLRPFKPLIKKTHPHKHDDYVELIFLGQGKGYHWIDRECYLIEPPMVFAVYPGQVHYWDITSIPEGYVLMIREEYFHHSGDSAGLALFRQLLAHKGNLRLAEAKAIRNILEAIQTELESGLPLFANMVQAWLHLLLVQLIRACEPRSAQPPGRVHRNYQQFIRLLRGGNPLHRRVYEYAQTLHITPQYLNTICREQCGKTAGGLLQEYQLSEAERYLIHTRLRVHEICYQLGFRDPSHFGKFFKRLSGHTPEGFRRKFVQSNQN